jgi:hypothetical protein
MEIQLEAWPEDVNKRVAVALRKLAKKLEAQPPTLLFGKVSVDINIEKTGLINMKIVVAGD